MKRKLRINPEARILTIPKEIVEEGFTGDVDAYANAKTLTIVHPEASLGEVKRSLEIVLQDINLRMGTQEKPREVVETREK